VPVELDRLLAAAIEEHVRLDKHRVSLRVERYPKDEPGNHYPTRPRDFFNRARPFAKIGFP
jgi:hypothetical protein